MDVHHKYHQYIHEYHQSSSISSIFININQPMDILFHWCTKKYGICWVWLSSMEKMPQPNPANSPLAWSRRVHHNIWRQGKLLGATTPLIHPGYPWLTYHCTGKSSVCRSYSEAKDFRPPPPELWFWDFTDFTDSGRRCKRSITFLGTSQGGVTNFLGKYPQIHSENFRWNWSVTSHKKLFLGLTWGTPVTCLAIFSSAEPSSRRWSSCTRSSTSRGTSAAKRAWGWWRWENGKPSPTVLIYSNGLLVWNLNILTRTHKSKDSTYWISRSSRGGCKHIEWVWRKSFGRKTSTSHFRRLSPTINPHLQRQKNWETMQKVSINQQVFLMTQSTQ